MVSNIIYLFFFNLAEEPDPIVKKSSGGSIDRGESVLCPFHFVLVNVFFI